MYTYTIYAYIYIHIYIYTYTKQQWYGLNKLVKWDSSKASEHKTYLINKKCWGYGRRTSQEAL